MQSVITVTLDCILLELLLLEHSKMAIFTTNSCPLSNFKTVQDILMKPHTNVKHHKTTCRAQERLLWIAFFWGYCSLNIKICHFYHILVSAP